MCMLCMCMCMCIGRVSERARRSRAPGRERETDTHEWHGDGPGAGHLGACTLPILWCTIRLALAECMQLAAKQGILIHASTGGVGLVAHEFAQRIGAAVSGSVGLPRWRTCARSAS